MLTFEEISIHLSTTFEEIFSTAKTLIFIVTTSIIELVISLFALSSSNS